MNRINDPSLPQYRYGNNARNNVIGPPLVDVDFSTSKNFRFSERRGLEFRTEFFNLLNHPIFGQPNTTVGTRISEQSLELASIRVKSSLR